MSTAGLHLEDDPRMLRGVLDATRLLVVVVDQDGMIRMVNRAFEMTTGRSSSESTRPIWELAELPVERDLLASAFRPFNADRFPAGILFHVASAAGGSRVVDWDVRLLEAWRGAPAFVLTGIDVSERLASQQRLRETEAFQRLVLDKLPAIVWTTDKELRTTFSAGGGLAALGLASGEMALMRTPVTSYFQTDDPSHPGIGSHLRALRGESCVFEMNWFGHQYQSRLEPLRDAQANIVGVIGLAFDVSEQSRLQQMRDRLLLQEQEARRETELANTRLLMLVEGSRRLSRTMSANATLETLAGVVIPGLADWSYIIHRGWNGGSTLLASAHGDPNKQALLRRLHGCEMDPNAPEGPPRVFRTGEVAMYADITDESLTPDGGGPTIVGMRDPAHLRVLRQLGMRSLLCVPIAGRNGVDAVMMLVSGADPRRYAAEDVVLAQDLASRAAVSLENGRLLFEALDAVRARDDFLAVAAHELRTPLTSLLLQVQVLERTMANDPPNLPAARRSIAAAEGQSRRISVLVDGLLDVARVTTNRVSLRLEELDLRELVEGVVAAMAEDFRRAGFQVTVTAPNAVLGRWDRVRIEQVMTNLLSNAVKFGGGRPIDVRVEATPTNARVSVRDHGMGIAKEDQTRIFGRFERAVSTRHYGGLGLGLYISSQILRMHQGTLHLESELGRGSCFIIDLPRGLQPSPGLSETPAGVGP